MDIAQEVRIVITRARAAGVVIDDGNVIDLLADNIKDVHSLDQLRDALSLSGLAHQFGSKVFEKHSFNR